MSDPLGWHSTTPVEDAVGTPAAGLSVLGPMLVTTPDGETRPRAGRQRRLLTVLAVHALQNRPVTVDELVVAVYGFDPAAPSRRSLATELWRARQVVGSDAIVTDADGYRLDPDLCRVDALTFETLLRRGRADLRAGDAAAAEPSLRAALDLWRGEPLTEWNDQAEGVAAAERLRELFTGGKVDHAETLAALGRHEESVRLLEAVTEAEPTNEHAWALLVEHDVALGRHRAAREAFDTARRTLAEYGVDVGAELDAARRVVGAAPVPHPVPADRAPAASLVGRVRETRQLQQTVETSLERSRFGLALITGEAGIGKTALVEHLVDELTGSDRPPTVVVAHCDRRTDLPYGPLAPALRSVGASGDVLGPIMASSVADPSGSLAPSVGSSRTVLHDAIAVGFESAVPAAGLVLVVEDVHWAPPDTLAALEALVARRTQTPFAVVLTARDPAPLDADVAGSLRDLRRRSDLVVDLRGLDLAGTAALVGSDRDPEDVSRLHRITGGHPLYLTHLRGMDPADIDRRVPTLDDAVDDHLAAVSDLAGRVLRLAAVIGTQVDLRVLTAAGARVSPPFSPLDVAEAVDEALAAGLLRRGSEHDGVSWVHEVVCTRLYAAIPTPVRVTLHVAVAEASERLVSGTPVALDLIAHHYASGWPHCSTELAVSRLAGAGDRAVAQLGFITASRYFRQATSLIGVDPSFTDVERTADLVEAEALSVLAAAGLPGAVNVPDDLARARALFEALGELGAEGCSTARLRSALGLARTAFGHRIDESVLDDLATGVAELLDDPQLASSVPLLDAGLVQLGSQRPAQADALLARAMTAQPGSSGRLRASAWARQGVATRLATAHELVRDPSADPLGAWTRLWVSEVTAGRRALDDPPSGRPEAAGSDDHSRWETEAWEVTIALAGGHYPRAERLLAHAARRVSAGRTALEIANRASAAAGQALRLRVLRARVPKVSDDAIPQGSFTNSHPLISHPVIGAWAAYMATMTGRLDDAYRGCNELVDQYLDGVVPEADVLPWACGTAVAALATGHQRASEFLRGVFEPHSGHIAVHTFTAYWGGVDHFLGRLALAAGDLDEAVDRLDSAVLQYRLTRARAYEGRALLDLASARWRVGGRARTDAQSHWHDAVALLDSLDPPGPDDPPWPAPG